MDTQRKLIVGYDLCEDFSQISCYSYKTFEPIPICYGDGEDDCLIPTVLCVRNDTRLWLFGKDAENCAAKEEGIKIDQILQKVKDNDEIEIYGDKFSGVALLEKFLRKTLTLVKNYFPTEQITKLVITIRDTDRVLADGIYQALSILGIEKDRAVVMNHSAAYLYYALSQDRSLWTNDVGLFDYGDEGLDYYQISIKRRSIPMVAGVTKTVLHDSLNYDMLLLQNTDFCYIFDNLAERILYKQIISTLYFTGKGFKEEWAANSITKLCVGRRVFLGQNLYTKGACYAAKELSGDKKLNNIILLNEDMIITSIWFWAYCDAKHTEIPVAEAGVPWYEVSKNIEVIPENETELEFIMQNIMTKEVTKKTLQLNQLPNRPNRMTRLEINISCVDKTTLKITITDLGFGDIYSGTGLINEYTVELV